MSKPVKRFFGGGMKMPKPEATKEMPVPDDEELEKLAMRKEMRKKRKGRASTILTAKNKGYEGSGLA